MLNRIPGATNVPTQVMQSLVQSMVSGELKEGDQLPSEAVIAQQMGAGISSVREALASLQGMGVIAVRHGAGRQVKGLTFAAISDPRLSAVAVDGRIALNIWEVRRTLEIESIRLAAQRATPEQIQAIRLAAEAMESAVRSGDLGAAEDGEIHKAIARATGNPVYAWLQESIEGLISGTRVRGLSHHGRQEESVKQHFQLVDCIERRDVEGAVETMLRHLEAQRGDAMEMLAEEESGKRS